MQVTVSEKMKEWVAGYIRSHRKEGTISIHVVRSKFNEDFRATFKADPQVAIRLMEASGFLKGCPSKGGYSIWLTEDAGKGKGRPYRSRTSRVNGAAASATTETKSAGPIEQKEEKKEIEMNAEEKKVEPHYAFEKRPHPETGQIDVLELIRYIVSFIQAHLPDEPVKDGPYSLSKLNVGGLLQECGLSAGDVPGMHRVLQNMGLIKNYNSGPCWGVLTGDLAAQFITADLYLQARQRWVKHADRNKEIAGLRKQLEVLPVSATETNPKEPKSTQVSSFYSEDEVLQLLAEVDELTNALETTKKEITELQTKNEGIAIERDKLAAELATRPASTDVVKMMIEERLVAAKKARSA